MLDRPFPSRREEKKLHPFFAYFDLRNLLPLLVVENPITNCVQTKNSGGNVVMLEMMFDVKQIGEITGIGAHRLELRNARAACDDK